MTSLGIFYCYFLLLWREKLDNNPLCGQLAMNCGTFMYVTVKGYLEHYMSSTFLEVLHWSRFHFLFHEQIHLESSLVVRLQACTLADYKYINLYSDKTLLY